MELDIFTLAHEIRNPLSISKGYLEMTNKDNLVKYKCFIEEGLKDALMVLDNYLMYNKLMPVFEEMDLILLLEELKMEYENLYQVKIIIEDNYNELYLCGDYNELKQVFSNLIKNSLEANATLIKINVTLNNDNLIIILDDNGIGFDNIIESYSTKVYGNGIGISIIKKILNLHGGKLEYLKNNDNGILSIVSLPTRQKEKCVKH